MFFLKSKRQKAEELELKEPAEGQDARNSERTDVYKDASLITLDGGKIRCAVRDISEGGARIAVQHMGMVPDDTVFDLALNGSRYRCFVKWRDGTQIGLTFKSPN